MVFCGECGTPVASVTSSGDRVAQLPHAPFATSQVRGPGDPAGKVAPRSPHASTLVGALPGVPVSPSNAPPPPGHDGRSTSKPPNERPTVLGMPAAAPAQPARSSGGGKKGRRGSSSNNEAAPRSEVKPPASEETPQIEVSTLTELGAAEALPAGIETALRKGLETAPAAAARPPTVPPPEAEETQRLLDDLDAGFDSIVRPSAPVVWLGTPSLLPDEPSSVVDKEVRATVPATPPSHDRASGHEPPPRPRSAVEASAARHEADMAEVRALFAGIAVAYARPLRDFMIEVAWGEPTKEWIDVALPAALALRRAAMAVEMPEVDDALEGYATALELAAGEATLHGEAREMLSAAYGRLVAAMPHVFALDGERGRREPILVRSLLLQVPGVRQVAIDKLYAAGIHSLEVFYAARPRELSEATGLDEGLATAIWERFQRYRREVAALSPSKDRAKERAELGSLVAELRSHHEEHERAAAGWSPEAAARRAKARKDRADTVLRIDVLLAQLGQVDLQRALVKMSFQQKIRELGRYLDEAEQKSARA